mmetsp:Transcript_20689/g.43822  ORF Transcript_20689/g.43822 Transcript_20689/m.43822 type:complete len:270 (+) Transcript_20689:679-1488(+)
MESFLLNRVHSHVEPRWIGSQSTIFSANIKEVDPFLTGGPSSIFLRSLGKLSMIKLESAYAAYRTEDPKNLVGDTLGKYSNAKVPAKACNHVDDDDDDDENDVRFAFQKYVPRRKLCPHIDGGVKEELTVMISGHFQQQYQPGLASSKASNASLATTTTTTAAASNKVSSPTKAKSTAGGGKASAGKPQGKKPTPHLRIKLGLGSKAKAERGEGSGSGKIGGVGDGGGVGVKSPSREMENQWPESGGYSEMKDGSKKKRVMSDREEFGF